MVTSSTSHAEIPIRGIVYSEDQQFVTYVRNTLGNGLAHCPPSEYDKHDLGQGMIGGAREHCIDNSPDCVLLLDAELFPIDSPANRFAALKSLVEVFESAEPIVVVATKDMGRDIVAAAAVGADFVVSARFTPKDLIEITRALRNKRLTRRKRHEAALANLKAQKQGEVNAIKEKLQGRRRWELILAISIPVISAGLGFGGNRLSKWLDKAPAWHAACEFRKLDDQLLEGDLYLELYGAADVKVVVEEMPPTDLVRIEGIVVGNSFELSSGDDADIHPLRLIVIGNAADLEARSKELRIHLSGPGRLNPEEYYRVLLPRRTLVEMARNPQPLDHPQRDRHPRAEEDE